MPLMDMSNFVAITHKVYEVNQMVSEAGTDLSVELAVWLQAKLQEQKFREQGTDESILTGPHAFLYSSQAMRDLAGRAYVAATRGWNKSPLATRDGFLTQRGKDLGFLANQIIEVINDNTDNSAWNPLEWRKAEDCFVFAAIPKKTISLLKLFDNAIRVAEVRFKDAMRQQLSSVTEDDNSDRPTTIGGVDFAKLSRQFIIPGLTADQQARDIKGIHEQRVTTMPGLLTPSLMPVDVANKPKTGASQHITPSDTVHMQDPIENGASWHAWVPAMAFTASTRHEIMPLYRHGLLDLRAYNSGNRGRARLVMRVSRIGDILLRDMAEQGI